VIWRTAQRLHAALAGRDVTAWDLRWPSLATTDLRGHQVVEVVSAGKHLLCRLVRGAERHTLHSHLRMEGSWHVHAADRPWRGGAARSDSGIRAVVGNDTWTAVGHRLGMLDLVPTSAEATLVGHLGPDVFGATWDPTTVGERIRARPDRAIGEALLDQTVLAGVGTFYMSEVLFLRGISPWTPAGDLSTSAIDGMVDLVSRVMNANRDRAVQITTGDSREGRTNHVHARSGRPCRRCGGTVRVAMIGPAPRNRTAFYCPSCQPGPHPTDSGAPQAPLGARRQPARRR